MWGQTLVGIPVGISADKLGELSLGYGCQVDPEAANCYKMRRRFFRTMPVGTHSEGASRRVDHALAGLVSVRAVRKDANHFRSIDGLKIDCARRNAMAAAMHLAAKLWRSRYRT